MCSCTRLRTDRNCCHYQQLLSQLWSDRHQLQLECLLHEGRRDGARNFSDGSWDEWGRWHLQKGGHHGRYEVNLVQMVVLVSYLFHFAVVRSNREQGWPFTKSWHFEESNRSYLHHLWIVDGDASLCRLVRVIIEDLGWGFGVWRPRQNETRSEVLDLQQGCLIISLEACNQSYEIW